MVQKGSNLRLNGVKIKTSSILKPEMPFKRRSFINAWHGWVDKQKNAKTNIGGHIKALVRLNDAKRPKLRSKWCQFFSLAFDVLKHNKWIVWVGG